MNKEKIQSNCLELLKAYKNGLLGQTKMPEDANPGFNNKQQEERLLYFTLPMALNYQRNSYKLWESALNTWNDNETKNVFNVNNVLKMSKQELQTKLLKHKLALQPNKHTEIWLKICKTINNNWNGVNNLIEICDRDFLELKKIIQNEHKKGFPYLSGPKIFNYWSFILMEYGNIKLKNKDYIEIAPDTHIIQCSVKLGVIKKDEVDKLNRDQISQRWRNILKETGISPIKMHPPLWFWSKNGFLFKTQAHKN